MSTEITCLPRAMTGRRTGPRRRSADRGAVMVIGVFMAAFLVGVLWYVIGIGDTILYRERMQDGADAVAYASAVYHARGMNLIAMINVIMAAILAILVALKLIQLINGIAFGVTTAICPWPGGQWACAPAAFFGKLVPKIAKAVNKYEKFTDKTLPALNKASTGLAYTMPWVAQGKAVYVSTQYSEPVQGGGMLSTSLVPGGGRLGLPVKQDKFSVLCKKAGEYVAEVVFSPLGGFAGIAKRFIGGLAKTFPGYFCGAGGGMADDLELDVAEAAVDQTCNLAKKDSGDDNFDMDKCKSDARKKMQEEARDSLGQQGGLTHASGNDKRPKAVWDYAENGNVYFQTWSFVMGDDKHPKQSEDGVKIATWNKGSGVSGGFMTAFASQMGRVGLAQAEFYCDRSGKFSDMKEDCMYNMWWRARMRRVRPPTGEAATLVAGAVGDKLLKGLTSKVSDAFMDSPLIDFVLAKGVEGKLKSDLTSILVDGSSGADSFIENNLLGGPPNTEMIH